MKMKSELRYVIIRRTTVEDLQQAVNYSSCQGWTPVGGPFVVYRSDDVISGYAQALVSPLELNLTRPGY